MTITTEDLHKLLDGVRAPETSLSVSFQIAACRNKLEGASESLAAELIAARAKIEAAQGALENIIHMGHDCPATFAGDEADWQAVRARLMQSYAKAVLAAWESLK